jgi:hypothetical protein
MSTDLLQGMKMHKSRKQKIGLFGNCRVFGRIAEVIYELEWEKLNTVSMAVRLSLGPLWLIG